MLSVVVVVVKACCRWWYPWAGGTSPGRPGGSGAPRRRTSSGGRCRTLPSPAHLGSSGGGDGGPGELCHRQTPGSFHSGGNLHLMAGGSFFCAKHLNNHHHHRHQHQNVQASKSRRPMTSRLIRSISSTFNECFL